MCIRSGSELWKLVLLLVGALHLLTWRNADKEQQQSVNAAASTYAQVSQLKADPVHSSAESFPAMQIGAEVAP